MIKLLQSAALSLLFVVQMVLASGNLVNINTANAAELAEGLVGVGQTRAEAIVAYREAYGDFATLEELTEVRGIGQSVLQKNRENIVLSDG